MPKEQLYEHLEAILGDKSTFGFNELRFDSAVNKEFNGDEKIKNTLELFSFGTLKTYYDYKSDFIELSDSALFKLAQLTLISEALTNNEFSYDHLKTVLYIQSTPELERLITESIYSKIIDAKLYNEQAIVKIYSSIGRDVLLDKEFDKKYGPNQRVSDLVTGLKSFGCRVDKGLNYIDDVTTNLESIASETTGTGSIAETPTSSASNASGVIEESIEPVVGQSLVLKRKRKIAEGK